MHNIRNLSSQIERLSRELAQARADNDVDEIERLEDELYELQEELDEASEAEGEGRHGWQ